VSSDLGPLLADVIRPADIGYVLFLLRDQLLSDTALEPFRQRVVGSELAEWIVDQLAENKGLQPKWWLSESDRRAVGAALVFILIGAAVLAAMEAAPQAFDHWSAWLDSTMGLTSLVLYLLYQEAGLTLSGSCPRLCEA
jgi:hypothetical protein